MNTTKRYYRCSDVFIVDCIVKLMFSQLNLISRKAKSLLYINLSSNNSGVVLHGLCYKL